jgi:hypothetical protein
VKRPRPTKKSLAQKRALLRGLIEQHGWASSTPVPLAAAGEVPPEPVLAAIIPFPIPARKAARGVARQAIP